jgi:hypothetical protein
MSVTPTCLSLVKVFATYIHVNGMTRLEGGSITPWGRHGEGFNSRDFLHGFSIIITIKLIININLQLPKVQQHTLWASKSLCINVQSYVNTSLVPQTNVILSTNWEFKFSQEIRTIKSLYKWTHHRLFITQACLILNTFAASWPHGEAYCRYSICTVHVTVMV